MNVTRFYRLFILITLLGIAVISVLFIIRDRRKPVPLHLMVSNGDAVLELKDGELIRGFQHGETTFFFLPSYSDQTLLDQGGSSQKILYRDSLLSEIRYDTFMSVDVLDESGGLTPWEIIFLRSKNLPAVYINLPDTSAEDIQHDTYSPASIQIRLADGSVNYKGNHDQIKGRGNSTWNYEKKPYSIKLSEKSSLCDMAASRKWVLLADRNDPSKLLNKMVFDTQRAVGMEYAPDSRWVNLYINGSYNGLYLLCEKIDIDESKLNIGDLEKMNDELRRISESDHVSTPALRGYDTSSDPENISGGYLLEYIPEQSYENHPCGFRLDRDLFFALRSPDNASLSEVSYIRSYMEDIDSLFTQKSPMLKQKIDYPSFAKRFLTEEFFYNYDFAAGSFYFYKKADSDILFAGPGWDYDNVCGYSLDRWSDPEGSVLISQRADRRLEWDRLLYEDEAYRKYLVSVFSDMLPVLEDLISTGIDRYVSEIRPSLEMERYRWDVGDHSRYKETDSDIRYIKLFLEKRLIFLCGKWDLETGISVESANTSHTVTFRTEDADISYQIPDAETIPEELLPGLPDGSPRWVCRHSMYPYSPYIPVLEDVVFVPQDSGYESILPGEND